MFQSQVWALPAGSAERVVAHAKFKKSRGLRPSMFFGQEHNPLKALQIAERIVRARQFEAQFPDRHDQTVIRLPRRDVMLARLEKVTTEPHIRENFFPLLLKQAGEERIAMGIVMTLALAIHDYTNGMPSIMVSAMLMGVGRYIDAITGEGNEYVAEIAKIHYRNIDKIRRAEHKKIVDAARPAREARNNEGITEDKRRTFDAAWQIVEIIRGYAEMGDIWLDDRRQEYPNPYYCQTRSGLLLELYYGMPSKLWTPWGEWGFGGSGSGDWKAFLPTILQRIGATVHKKIVHSSQGEFGPVYSIHLLDGVELPAPVVCPRAEYLEYGLSRKEWEQLVSESRSRVSVK